MTPTVSFIIPHKGREGMLIETLRSISELDYPGHALEVIVVSQNESTSESLKSFQNSLRLLILFNQAGKTISHSRNFGASKAKGEYLAFLDADIALSKNWIKTMLRVLSSQTDTLLVSAMQQNSDDAPPLECIRTALSNAELDTTVAFLPGRNLFLHQTTFEKVGGFPEHLITCEDYYFTDQVNKLGNLYYTSKASYIHIGEDKHFIPMFKKEVWRGQSNLASLRGRKIPFRELPSFIVPFVVVIALILSIVMLSYSKVEFAILFALISLFPLSVYTLRLKILTKSRANWAYCILFYILYFPARAWGTLMGIGKTIGTSTHK